VIVHRGQPSVIRMYLIKDGIPVHVDGVVLHLESEEGQFVEYPASSSGNLVYCLIPDLKPGLWKASFRFGNYKTEAVHVTVVD